MKKLLFALGMVSAAAVTTSGFGAITLSAPTLNQGSAGTGAHIDFTSDQDGVATVYVIANSVSLYNPGEIVATLRGNIVAGSNTFLWNGYNVSYYNQGDSSGVGATNRIADGSNVTLRVVAMNTGQNWTSDWVVGGAARGYWDLSYANGQIFATDFNATTARADDKVWVYNSADGSQLQSFTLGAVVDGAVTANNFTFTTALGRNNGGFWLVARNNFAGSGSFGCLYNFASNGALASNYMVSSAAHGSGMFGDGIGLEGTTPQFYVANGAQNGASRHSVWNAATATAFSISGAAPLTNASPTVEVAAVDNGASPRSPVIYLTGTNTSTVAGGEGYQVVRADWNGAGYIKNMTFRKNFLTEQNLARVDLNVAGVGGAGVVNGSYGGPWGETWGGVAIVNKGDVNSDIFVKTMGSNMVMRVHPDGTSAWGAALRAPARTDGAGIASDGTNIYFTMSSAGQLWANQRVVRDAPPEMGESSTSAPFTWAATLVPVGMSKLNVE